MKAIVFGGSGFIGSHIADLLSAEGHEVVIFDVVPSQYLREGQRMIVGDILDQAAVIDAMESCDVVYHFAGLADLDEAASRPRDTVMLNVLGTIHVLEGAVKHKIRRLVYASSLYVYSEKGGFYRCSKQAAEGYVEEYQRQFGVEYTILRFGTLYGPRADSRNSVYRYIRDALTRDQVVIGSTGEERREYIYVKDAARLSLDVLTPEYVNMRVTLTGHQSILFRELMYTITEMLNRDVEVVFAGRTDDSHYAYTPYSYVPKSGLKLTLNPFTDLGQGLLESIEDIANNLEQETK